MSWEHRLECLEALQEVGFQVGTGVMVGLPGQTLCDLAGDVAFFKRFGANMIGMVRCLGGCRGRLGACGGGGGIGGMEGVGRELL